MDLITWPLRIVSASAVIWVLWQVFSFDNSDDSQDAGYVPWQMQLREMRWVIPICVLFVAACIAAGVAFVFFPEPLRSQIIGVSLFLFSTIKWILMGFTFFGVNWVLWYLYVDKSNDDAFERWSWLWGWLGSPFSLASGARNVVTGIQLMLFANFFLLCLTYNQLPEGLQHVINGFLNPAKPIHP